MIPHSVPALTRARARARLMIDRKVEAFPVNVIAASRAVVSEVSSCML
jgi:hypothetical protein